MAKRVRRFNLPKYLRIRNLIFIIVLIVVCAWLFNWIHSFIAGSPYFKISKIEIAIIGRASLSDKTIKELLTVHKGKNIFDVNLKATKDYILSNYPEIRTLVINRVFPNKLVLNVRPRRPVAQISVSLNFYLVDTQGMILPQASSLASEGLPIISGADSRRILSSIGKECDYDGLKKALRLLEVINQMKFSQEHEVHMIDISDEKNLSLYIEGGIEIKIGGEDFRQRLNMLNKTFEAGRFVKDQIRYIDLRFGNVVIGPR